MTKEEAIKVVRNIYQTDAEKVALETLIPELKESEDERIRKAIINYILYETKGNISEATEHVWVTWLEKQKEQKPVESEQNPLVKMLEDKKAITEDIRNGIPTKIIEKERNVKFATPVDMSHIEWSDEDWKLLDEVREHIIGVTGDKPDLTPNKIYDGFLNLIDRLKFAKPQLKQKWSKEDKDVIDEAAELALGWGCPNLSAKLKSILSRVKSVEWSEEDEHRKKDAIYFLESAKKHYADTSEIEKTIGWLKSLRLVSKESLQSHWKPSEEQMEALKCAVEDVAKFSKRGGRQVELENEPYYSALHSLYCNLEKLM